MSGPYGTSAVAYWDAGWRGVLPLPPGRKGPPPGDYTGWNAATPSRPDIEAWVEDRSDGNVALHLPPGVVGLDVDAYGTKAGAASLASGERVYGELPATWVSTSRDDGVSGIRLYRVPVGLRWPGSFGPGTETIHAGHRYAVVWPSMHPDTGRRYQWITPTGEFSIAPPRISELPELPMSWVVGLTEGREARMLVGAGMEDAEIEAWLYDHFTGPEPCDRMAEAVEDTLRVMRDGAHESLAQLMRVVGLAGRGHHGLRPALATIKHAFTTEVTRPGRDGQRTESEAGHEWSRSLFGATDKVVAERIAEGLAAPSGDPCLFGEPSLVERSVTQGEYPEPASDGPGATSTEDPGHEDRGGSDEASSVPTPEQAWERAVVTELVSQRVRSEAKRRLEAENAPALRIMGFGEFLNAPRPEPIVHRMLYIDSLARIYGPPGCGKSFLSLDVAFHVALGRDWGGEPVRQGPVVYVMAEGQRVNTVRAMAWMERHGVTADDLEGRFWAVPDKVLLTEAAAAPFVAEVARLQPVLVILDTQNAMQVGEENSATDTRVMRDALDAMRRVTNACVCLIGHTGKANTDQARGSNAAEGAMDTEVKVSKTGEDGEPPRITVEVTRDKADENGTTWEFRLRHHPLPDQLSGAVLVPVTDDDGPRERHPRERPVWLDEEVVMPVEIEDGFTGRGKGAMPYVFKFLSTDANPRKGDPSAIGVTMAQTVAAVKAGSGFERSSVTRCWSWLRDNEWIGPADDKWDKNTTGKHIWLRHV